MRDRRIKTAVIGASVALVAAAHQFIPVGPHAWHWLHLLAQKLYYVPILLTAAWCSATAVLGTTTVISLLFTAHILRDWAGLPMLQADQVAEIANLWIVAVVSAILFSRERAALGEVRWAHEETLIALASSLELRERYTAGHSRRVRDYALLLADAMELKDRAFRESLARGALLHDLGKIGIPDRILLKDGTLSSDEWNIMRRHPEFGASLIGDIRFLRGARGLVLAHHERFDGTGYPNGLAGREIPLGARIFAVADTFDALTTDRPYHRAVPYSEAVRQIAAGRGSQFDPVVVEAFLKIPEAAWVRVASAAAPDPGSVATGTIQEARSWMGT